jgi:hypothetical protein
MMVFVEGQARLRWPMTAEAYVPGGDGGRDNEVILEAEKHTRCLPLIMDAVRAKGV